MNGPLVKEFVHMPKDLRKVICIKCSETEAHENAVWLAVDPNEVCDEFLNFKYVYIFFCLRFYYICSHFLIWLG